MAHKMNVESFNLDHTKVAAPFVRVADVKHLPAGDTLTKYDVRFCQPNKEHLEMPAVHSLEHSFAECVRNHSDAVIDFGPMGSRPHNAEPPRRMGTGNGLRTVALYPREGVR